MATWSPRANEIFLRALELGDPDARSALVDEACREEPELRDQVQSLLDAGERAGSFLDRPAVAPGATRTFPPARGAERAAVLPGEGTGTQIGPYKLLQQIGEGGMGTVYMAEQSQPLQRRVALKLIKPGMDSRLVIARFEAERQALALMDHVNIARVFDGGATEAGLPYFVMELVHGVPITKYCDDHHLTPRERLELFLPVCQAIQHAHQKGIIHRDIKPSNVMVTLYDGKPVPKVIDFGVAKATDQRLTERTLFTQYGTMVGTLEYMSPEQAETSALGVDTRSDIYSLGVLLYELLTGSTPLTRKRLKDAAYAEVLRLIREEEAPRPSTRLSDSGAALASISAQRHMEPAKLTRLVRGELDWIVMTCLEKDRSRRYETANAFAADVQRYLSDEAVQACPPSAAYRVKKFARRNRSGLAVAGLVLFFLVLLGSGVGWTWRDRAARAGERANHLEHAVERAELLQREGKRGEAQTALERAQLLAREAETAPALAERLESLQQLLDAEGRDEVLVARFEAIRRDVQTEVDVEKSLFRSDRAYPTIRDALERYGIALGVTPPAAAVTRLRKRPAAIQAVVIGALDECMAYAPAGDPGPREWLIDVLLKADADPWRNKIRRAAKQPATLEALAKDVDVRQQPPSFLMRVALALPVESPGRLDLARRVQFAYPGDFLANHQLGLELVNRGKDAEAIRYYTAALGLHPDNPGVLLNRANALRRAGELEAARADLHRAIAVAPRYAAAYDSLGAVLRDQKTLPEAIVAHHKAIEIDPKSANAHNNLGVALHGQQKLGEAIDCYRKAVELAPNYPNAYSNLGNALTDQNKLPEAIDAYRKAIELHPRFAKAHNNLGVALHGQQKLGEAIAAFRKATEAEPKYAEAYRNLGLALHAQKKPGEAIAAFRKATEAEPKSAAAHSSLGALLCDHLKDHDKAIECFRKAIELDPTFADARRNLGVALTGKGWDLINPAPKPRDPKRALEALTEAVELAPNSEEAWQCLGCIHYRAGNWKSSIEALEKSCKLQMGGTGDAGQWIVLALAHAKLAAQEGCPENERERHGAEARRWFDRADKQIDAWWHVRPGDTGGQAVWDFRTEAREFMRVEPKKD